VAGIVVTGERDGALNDGFDYDGADVDGFYLAAECAAYWVGEVDSHRRRSSKAFAKQRDEEHGHEHGAQSGLLRAITETSANDEIDVCSINWYEDFFTASRSICGVRPFAKTKAGDFRLKRCTASGAHVLDVPCGNGRLSFELAKRGFSVRNGYF
jgi:hypothetical protein